MVLSYAGGPDLTDLSDPYGIARGPVEAKLGIFRLNDAGALGIMVGKVLKGKEDTVDFDSAIFIPWAAIHTMDLLTASISREPEEGK